MGHRARPSTFIKIGPAFPALATLSMILSAAPPAARGAQAPLGDIPIGTLDQGLELVFGR
jgi:hypothetical protein